MYNYKNNTKREIFNIEKEQVGWASQQLEFLTCLSK